MPHDGIPGDDRSGGGFAHVAIGDDAVGYVDRLKLRLAEPVHAQRAV